MRSVYPHDEVFGDFCTVNSYIDCPPDGVGPQHERVIRHAVPPPSGTAVEATLPTVLLFCIAFCLSFLLARIHESPAYGRHGPLSQAEVVCGSPGVDGPATLNSTGCSPCVWSLRPAVVRHDQ